VKNFIFVNFRTKKNFIMGNSKTKKNFIIDNSKLKKRPPCGQSFNIERMIPVYAGITTYDTSIMENTMTNSATVSPTPSTIR